MGILQLPNLAEFRDTASLNSRKRYDYGKNKVKENHLPLNCCSQKHFTDRKKKGKIEVAKLDKTTLFFKFQLSNNGHSTVTIRLRSHGDR